MIAPLFHSTNPPFDCHFLQWDNFIECYSHQFWLIVCKNPKIFCVSIFAIDAWHVFGEISFRYVMCNSSCLNVLSLSFAFFYTDMDEAKQVIDVRTLFEGLINENGLHIPVAS